MKTHRLLMMVLLLLLLTPHALAGEFTAAGLFTVTYDDSLTMDDVSYQYETTDLYRWFFVLYGDDFVIDANTEWMELFDGVSLHTATQEERDAYLQDMADYYPEASYLQTITATHSGIPFYVFRFESDEGPFLLAETVVNGYAIDFYAYYYDESQAPDDALMEALTALLQTFTPAA